MSVGAAGTQISVLHTEQQRLIWSPADPGLVSHTCHHTFLTGFPPEPHPGQCATKRCVQSLVPEKQHKNTAGQCEQTFLPGPPSPGVQQCPPQGSAEVRGVGSMQGPGRAVPQPSEGRAAHPRHSSVLQPAAITSVSRDFCQAQRPLGLDPLHLGCHLRACHPLEKQLEVSPTASCPFPRRSCYCDLNGPMTRPLSKP